ncbi:N-acetylmuramidase domain-containing protein, partial [uncultured Muribaculum sp.]
FWGMFQIGGFNWKKCGAESPVDFARRMSTSEKEQLELFVNFLKSNNLAKYLKAKNWAGFALRYNGPSYAKRGYHTRLAKAYSKYKKQSKK